MVVMAQQPQYIGILSKVSTKALTLIILVKEIIKAIKLINYQAFAYTKRTALLLIAIYMGFIVAIWAQNIQVTYLLCLMKKPDLKHVYDNLVSIY